jgi:hypothetical protein
MSDVEINFDNAQWDRMYKTYIPDVKFVFFNFPTDTGLQRAYWERKLRKAKNPVIREEIEIEIATLEWISENRSDETHCLIYFSEDPEEHTENTIRIFDSLSRGRFPIAERLPAEKKKQILYKFHNKNALLRSL